MIVTTWVWEYLIEKKIPILFLNFILFSLEVDTCVERLGKAFIAENSE
jgi:hypothetical protein